MEARYSLLGLVQAVGTKLDFADRIFNAQNSIIDTLLNAGNSGAVLDRNGRRIKMLDSLSDIANQREEAISSLLESGVEVNID